MSFTSEYWKDSLSQTWGEIQIQLAVSIHFPLLMKSFLISPKSKHYMEITGQQWDWGNTVKFHSTIQKFSADPTHVVNHWSIALKNLWRCHLPIHTISIQVKTIVWLAAAIQSHKQHLLPEILEDAKIWTWRLLHAKQSNGLLPVSQAYYVLSHISNVRSGLDCTQFLQLQCNSRGCHHTMQSPALTRTWWQGNRLNTKLTSRWMHLASAY